MSDRFLTHLLGPYPKLRKAKPVVRESRYDSAGTGADNRDHWKNADSLGPNGANSPDVRRILRERARYERDNDPYLCGLVKQIANDEIGTGPRLQLATEEELYDSARIVETKFAKWCERINLAGKLRIMREVRPVDGESFARLFSNEAVEGKVKLDLLLLESEQIATPNFNTANTQDVDGIEFDKFGNPAFYHVLNEHPGDSGLRAWFGPKDYERVPANLMIHWFRPSRPGQARGVSEFASSLQTGAMTRTYSKAVLAKAVAASKVVGVMETETTQVQGDAPDIEAMEEIQFPDGTFLTLPYGQKAKLFDSGNTTTGYKEFVGEKRSEMGRAVQSPFNVTTGNSSGYNYSSGRLDHVPYHRVIWDEREELRTTHLTHILKAWYDEAVLVGEIPSDMPDFEEWNFDFQWDAFDSIDPVKDAAAWKELLLLKVTTRTEICASRGLRFREVIDTLAAEEDYMRLKGLDPAVEPVAAIQPKTVPAVGDDEDTTLDKATSRAVLLV